MARRAAAPATHRALPLLLLAGIANVVWAADPPAVAPATPAAETAAAESPADPADLGRGLRYYRPAPDDETAFTAALAAPALVLDLRGATDGGPAAAHLAALLEHGTATRPLFILLDESTPEKLSAAIPVTAPGILTIAPKNSDHTASVRIEVGVEQERAAVAALLAGQSPRELTEEKLAKKRYDEAALAHDHANGVHERPARDTAPEGDTAAQPATADLPPHDLLLQRAVFIHRGLLALGRIPDHT